MARCVLGTARPAVARLAAARLAVARLAVALFGALLLASLASAQDEQAKKPAVETPAVKTPAVETPATEPPKPAPDEPAPAVTEDAGTPDAGTPDVGTPDAAAAQARFQLLFDQWRGMFVQLRKLKTDYHTADEAQQLKIRKQWDATIAEGEALLPTLIDAALAVYVLAPNEDRIQTEFLAKVLSDFVERDLYEEAMEIARVLVDNQCDRPEVYSDAGIAAWAMNDYDQTTHLMNVAEKVNLLPGDADKQKVHLADYERFWKTELKLRAEEAEADDLPRAKITTNKGDIVVELFENQAPDTVGNFVSLVKRGFYDGLTFHRVQSGFMAQGGCPDGNGTGGPGYKIYDECERPEIRKHFRGVLSMAKTFAPNSAGSQFFFTYRPVPHLDGKHTVFGRVIKGMDVVTNLQRRDADAQEEGEPLPEADQIVKIEILRARDHEYLPNKVN